MADPIPSGRPAPSLPAACAGAWLLIVCLPSDDRRCRDATMLLQMRAALHRHGARLALLVAEAPAAAALIGATADHRAGAGDHLVLADPDGRLAAALGLADAGGRPQRAAAICDPAGVRCAVARPGTDGDLHPGDLLAMVDAVRAGRAGCAGRLAS